ncbi:putative 2-amino-3-carboxymuconate-6-semialdehyde decarboxylase [Apodospora peruviana]|uniref:6-methylsalicylate decarboxylase n=1 Tax=Apodospora peruviana TaxID=516989 RepID=A0AAE0LYR1_9PEZI|nr:putative 2-amino-3-carboxymuconate-6-semialdehyde decarboxylase [Apodospora peruviana]
MRGYAQQWYLDKGVTWNVKPAMNKIDLHHHMVPDFYAKGALTANLPAQTAVEEAGGDPSGWPTPQWSPSSSRMIMKHMGIQSAILSVTAPGACILPSHDAQAALARQLNEYAAHLRDEDHSRFGFFASLPDITNTTLALEEIAYAFDVLRADGVTLFTRYGSNATYLGNPLIEPIWKELDKRAATVFVHPTHPVDLATVNQYMAQPFIDYPHETTRAAVDMITQRTLKKFPNVKVILSHAGGTLPYLAGRFLTPLKKVNNVVAGYMVGTSYDDGIEAITKGFYYDLALSTEHKVLSLLEEMGVVAERVVYGSDFPYAPPPAHPAFLEELETFNFSSPEMRNRVNFGNAQQLISRLGGDLDVAEEPKDL